MYIKRFLVSVVCSLTGILIQGASAQTPSALTGLVTCSEEGLMEGVVVSAKKDGSTISVSVITNAEGRFAFPATRLEAGLYTLRARAAGYELDGASAVNVAAGQEAKAEIKLKKVKNLSAHLTNAEWLMSMWRTGKLLLKKEWRCYLVPSATRRVHTASASLKWTARNKFI